MGKTKIYSDEYVDVYKEGNTYYFDLKKGIDKILPVKEAYAIMDYEDYKILELNNKPTFNDFLEGIMSKTIYLMNKLNGKYVAFLVDSLVIDVEVKPYEYFYKKTMDGIYIADKKITYDGISKSEFKMYDINEDSNLLEKFYKLIHTMLYGSDCGYDFKVVVELLTDDFYDMTYKNCDIELSEEEVNKLRDLFYKYMGYGFVYNKDEKYVGFLKLSYDKFKNFVGFYCEKLSEKCYKIENLTFYIKDENTYIDLIDEIEYIFTYEDVKNAVKSGNVKFSYSEGFRDSMLYMPLTIQISLVTIILKPKVIVKGLNYSRFEDVFKKYGSIKKIDGGYYIETNDYGKYIINDKFELVSLNENSFDIECEGSLVSDVYITIGDVSYIKLKTKGVRLYDIEVDGFKSEYDINQDLSYNSVIDVVNDKYYGVYEYGKNAYAIKCDTNLKRIVGIKKKESVGIDENKLVNGKIIVKILNKSCIFAVIRGDYVFFVKYGCIPLEVAIKTLTKDKINVINMGRYLINIIIRDYELYKITTKDDKIVKELIERSGYPKCVYVSGSDYDCVATVDSSGNVYVMAIIKMNRINNYVVLYKVLSYDVVSLFDIKTNRNISPKDLIDRVLSGKKKIECGDGVIVLTGEPKVSSIHLSGNDYNIIYHKGVVSIDKRLDLN